MKLNYPWTPGFTKRQPDKVLVPLYQHARSPLISPRLYEEKNRAKNCPQKGTNLQSWITCIMESTVLQAFLAHALCHKPWEELSEKITCKYWGCLSSYPGAPSKTIFKEMKEKKKTLKIPARKGEWNLTPCLDMCQKNLSIISTQINGDCSVAPVCHPSFPR